METLYWSYAEMQFCIFIQIDVGSMFFGISAQNDAEWWSSCPDSIDFWLLHIILENLRKYLDHGEYGEGTPRDID